MYLPYPPVCYCVLYISENIKRCLHISFSYDFEAFILNLEVIDPFNTFYALYYRYNRHSPCIHDKKLLRNFLVLEIRRKIRNSSTKACAWFLIKKKTCTICEKKVTVRTFIRDLRVTQEQQQ